MRPRDIRKKKFFSHQKVWVDKIKKAVTLEGNSAPANAERSSLPAEFYFYKKICTRIYIFLVVFYFII